MVLKAVTHESAGSGLDVVICHTLSEVRQAAANFQPCTHVAEEYFLPIVGNLCLNYVVAANGRIIYLGCAEQVCDATEKYFGNWIDPAAEAPAAAVQLGINLARAGFERRFWGCLGVDTAVLDDSRIVAFDLNFRINGSTRALLLAESVRHRFGLLVIRLRDWKANRTYRDMLDVVYSAMSRGILLPLCSYDPEVGKNPGVFPRITGLILGTTRAEVLERERELTRMGLVA